MEVSGEKPISAKLIKNHISRKENCVTSEIMGELTPPNLRDLSGDIGNFFLFPPYMPNREE